MAKQNPGRVIGPQRGLQGRFRGVSSIVEGENVPVNETQAFLQRHLSTPRFGHYLAHCNGDVARAEVLYTWNTQISAAMWEPLSLLEVALRNTIDRQMSNRHRKLGRGSHWIFDDHRELGRDRHGQNKHAQPFKDVETAKRRVKSNRRQLNAGQVMSEISFGFWHQMVSRAQQFVWPDLASGFPHAPNRAQGTIHDPISRIRDIRNRIGHHHRIWNLDIEEYHFDILAVAGYIEPRLETWIESRSRVPRILGARP